ncbi:MAG: hypothetical protein QOH32_4171 [Bradyrhizobium sp.]|jgi:hypothetical protein|nr:hypothetical protein [Bradyrhizobium sp.]
MRLSLRNPGKKKLNAVTVTFGEHLTELVYQIDDGPELFGPAERKIVVGDLQPSKTTTLHIWTQFAYVDWDSSRLPILFSVAADEFDKFTLKFPFPGYLKSALIWRLGWYAAYLTAIIALSVALPELVRWLARLKT